MGFGGKLNICRARARFQLAKAVFVLGEVKSRLWVLL